MKPPRSRFLSFRSGRTEYRDFVCRAIIQALLLLGFLLPCLPAAAQDEWPMFRHDARNTGFSPVTIAPPLRLAWQVRVTTGLMTPPLMNADAVLLASAGIVCVSEGPHTATSLYDLAGHLRWQIPDAFPLYLKGRRLVVTISHKGQSDVVSCYDWPSHRRLWSHKLRGSLYAFYGMVESGGRLYGYYTFGPVMQASESQTVLLTLRLADGALLTEQLGDSDLWGAGCPAVDGRYLCYGASHWLHVVDARTLLPTFAFADGGNCYLIRVGRLLIAKGWEHILSAWDMQTQRLTWQIGCPRDVVHCLARGKKGAWLLIESSSARDVHSGKQVWNAPIYSYSAAGAGNMSIWLADRAASMECSLPPENWSGAIRRQGCRAMPLWSAAAGSTA